MRRTRVKICGVTRVEDALAAARAGADAIGMVFYSGAKRCITAERAKEILSVLPPFVTSVGLFVDSPAAEVRRVALSLGLRHVQLHGHEDAESVRQLEGFAVLKAVRVAREIFRSELDAWREAIASGLPQLRGLVLETPTSAPGGTGIENDWNAVREAQAAGAFTGLPPIIAAGGLTPENVAPVVRDLHPWAVDVSSGVEESFGHKSSKKIEAFIAAVADGTSAIDSI
jgi:phosphoribosylanthranilate isomerase